MARWPLPPQGRERSGILLVALLFTLLALFLRVHNLDGVPPGVHYDEILNGEIAETARAEGPRIYYPRSGGREGLYHLFLVATLSLPLPDAWQLRLPSILLSLMALLFTMLWVRRAFGSWAALTALGMLGVSFWPVWMGRAALRATTVTPIDALAAYLLVRLLREKATDGRARLATAVGLGIALGLSFYTYRAGGMIFVTYLAFAFYLFVMRRRESRALFLPLMTGLLVATPILLIFLARPELDPRFGQVALPWQALREGDLRHVLDGIVAHLGMFFWRGDLESHYNLPGRPIFEPAGALLFVAGLAIAVRRWRQPLYAFCLLWLGIGVAPGVFTIPAPSFVHTISAQGVIFVFPAIAVQAAYERLARRSEKRAAGFTLAAVTLLIAANSVLTFVDYFERWPRVAEVRAFHQTELALIARDLDQLNEPAPVAVCSSVLNEEDSFWRSGRQSIRFMMAREELAIRWYDCGSAQVIPAGQPVQLYFPNGTELGAWLAALPDGVQVTRMAGDVTHVTADGTSWQEAVLAQIAPANAADGAVQFGDELRFLGYRFARMESQPGGELALLTHWRVSGPLPPRRSLFVHLLDGNGDLVAQGDSFTVLSDTLETGDVVVQLHRFTIPADAAPGHYSLSTGVYSLSGDQPPLLIESGRAAGQARLELTTLEVTVPAP